METSHGTTLNIMTWGFQRMREGGFGKQLVPNLDVKQETTQPETTKFFPQNATCVKRKRDCKKKLNTSDALLQLYRLGRKFVDLYYRGFGTKAAKALDKTPIFKLLVRWSLDTFVALVIDPLLERRERDVSEYNRPK